MKRFLFIYLPIICIAVAALLKLNSGAIDHEVKNESEPPVQIDSSLTDIPPNTMPTKEEEELKELKEQIQQLNEKVSDLEKENDQLTKLKPEEESQKPQTSIKTEDELLTEEKPIEDKTETEKTKIVKQIFNSSEVDYFPRFSECRSQVTALAVEHCFESRLTLFILDNFSLPRNSTRYDQNEIEFSFVVSQNGTITDVIIKKSPSILHSGELRRVLSNLPRLSPATLDGRFVQMRHNFRFKSKKSNSKYAYQNRPQKYERTGYVTRKWSVSLYSSPSEVSEIKLKKVSSAEKIYIINMKDYGRFALIWTNGMTGYIRKSDIRYY